VARARAGGASAGRQGRLAERATGTAAGGGGRWGPGRGRGAGALYAAFALVAAGRERDRPWGSSVRSLLGGGLDGNLPAGVDDVGMHRRPDGSLEQAKLDRRTRGELVVRVLVLPLARGAYVTAATRELSRR
jgi:hypothetical protein